MKLPLSNRYMYMNAFSACHCHKQFWMFSELSQFSLCWWCLIFQNREKVMALLTYPTVEEAIIKRVEMKAKTYGQEVTLYKEEKEKTDLVYKIQPTLVADLYGDWIMPMTKEVQVEYLLRRLDWESLSSISIHSYWRTEICVLLRCCYL